jgi:hypothetical protein
MLLFQRSTIHGLADLYQSRLTTTSSNANPLIVIAGFASFTTASGPSSP